MGKVDQRRLARCIGDAAPPGRQPGEGGDIDDPSRLMTPELYCKCSCEQVWPAQIGFEYTVPNIAVQRLQMGERDANVPCRIVHQDIQLAELSQDLADACLYGEGIALIELNGVGAPAGSPHRLSGCRCAFAAANIGESNVYAC